MSLLKQAERLFTALNTMDLDMAVAMISPSAGGTAIDNLAEVVDDGGTIINFGSLGSNTGN